MGGLQHKDDYYETPKWLFNKIQDLTGLKFETDLCATNDNSLCDGWFNERMDFLVILIGMIMIRFIGVTRHEVKMESL